MSFRRIKKYVLELLLEYRYLPEWFPRVIFAIVVVPIIAGVFHFKYSYLPNRGQELAALYADKVSNLSIDTSGDNQELLKDIMARAQVVDTSQSGSVWRNGQLQEIVPSQLHLYRSEIILSQWYVSLRPFGYHDMYTVFVYNPAYRLYLFLPLIVEDEIDYALLDYFLVVKIYNKDLTKCRYDFYTGEENPDDGGRLFLAIVGIMLAIAFAWLVVFVIDLVIEISGSVLRTFFRLLKDTSKQEI